MGFLRIFYTTKIGATKTSPNKGLSEERKGIVAVRQGRRGKGLVLMKRKGIHG